jgi:hypothetical protein
MRDVRFREKDGQSIDVAVVRRRFFDAAMAASDRAFRIWNNAIFLDLHARVVVEKQCGIEFVAVDAGFGFLE